MTAEGIPVKLALLRDNLEKLELIPHGSLAEFLADFRNLDSALHRLQTSIQALIDFASYAVASRGFGVPQSSLDAFEKLEERGLLPSGTSGRIAPIIGFRNRVVHVYDRIDPALVFQLLTQHRHDIAELGALLAALLD